MWFNSCGTCITFRNFYYYYNTKRPGSGLGFSQALGLAISYTSIFMVNAAMAAESLYQINVEINCLILKWWKYTIETSPCPYYARHTGSVLGKLKMTYKVGEGFY